LSVMGHSRYTRGLVIIQITGFSMQQFFALVLLVALSLIGLTGCGNKGPLYLPPEPVEEIPAEVETPVDTEPS